MKKFVKAGLMLVLGLSLVAPGMTTPADAASKVKVVSTTTIAKKAYHGKKGYIYSSSKLTKKKYKMKSYKYTTWYGTKKATIKKKGKKKASLTYIKAGKKKGWIYSKYLTAGKAPINKVKIQQNEIVKYNKVISRADDYVQQDGVISISSDYEVIGNDIQYKSWRVYDSLSDLKKNRTALLDVYALFKSHFTTSQKTNLDAMAKDIENMEVTNDNDQEFATKLDNFADSIGDLVYNLN